MPREHEERAFLLGVGVQPRAHRRLGRQALGRNQHLDQRAPRDLLEVQRLAGSLEDGLGGVEMGHGGYAFNPARIAPSMVPSTSPAPSKNHSSGS